MERSHRARKGLAPVRSRDPPVSPESPGVKERWYDHPTLFPIPDFLKAGDGTCPVCWEMVTRGKKYPSTLRVHVVASSVRNAFIPGGGRSGITAPRLLTAA